MKPVLVLLLMSLCVPVIAEEKPAAVPNLAELQRMQARFAPTEIRVDLSHLSPGDRQALAKLVEAARVVDDLFLIQAWSGNHGLLQQLRRDKRPLGRAHLRYFWLNKSPWSELDGHTAFLPGVPPKKPLGANYYPADITKDEFEAWVKELPADQQTLARGFFSVVQRHPETRKLTLIAYSDAYAPQLDRLAALLREAAALTTNASLKKFLTTRADALFSNDYYVSDVAWMDLGAPIDVTLGPYETYLDELFGYKAAFEAYITLRDDAETRKIARFSQYLQEIEDNLPIPAQHRNPKLGALAPIRVVNSVFSSGDGNHGVQTAAYNLPNDEKVIQEMGSKKVMLKNIQEAKFRRALVPIASRVLSPADRAHLDFDLFFTHILAHEITHGLGPHSIKVDGRETSARKELKELYGAIEEAKADATGLFALQYLHDKERGQAAFPDAYERRLYSTFLASAFRSLRFGVHEAHGRGMALQFNYLTDKGAFVANPDGTFRVDFTRIRQAVRDLDHDLLMLEARGDYIGAKKMLDDLAVIRPPLQKVLDALKDIPTDIEPIFVTAGQLAPAVPAVRRGRKRPPRQP